MSATRVTVALNAKQSQMAPLLVPASASIDPVDASSIRALVFKTTQSKLRLQKPARLFVGGTGQELLTKEDWEENIKNDIVLLVSAGEEHVGVERAFNVQDANPRCSVEVLASKAPLEGDCITQLVGTARMLPGIVRAVGQPDLHQGNKFPIGAVFVSKKWIHPLLIGSDIGCGMAWYKTTLPRKHVNGDKGKKVAEKLRSLEGTWLTQTDRTCGSKMNKAVARRARSGSAHLGLSELATISRRFRRHRSLGAFGFDDIDSTKKALQQRKVVDIWHNNIERVLWPPSSPPSLTQDDTTSPLALAEVTTGLSPNNDTPTQDYVYMHRKGAAPTYDPSTQLPLTILPLPGSRGTPTLTLQPTFSAHTSWGLKNTLSLARVAGRAMSRAKALSALSQKYKGQNILEPGSSDIDGTWVICDEKDLVWEEAPEAYKDVEVVGQDLVDAGVARAVGKCRARISYKVRIEGR
ncbi:hypothetical protein P153DRAFT_383826 [Dothidotthia symphoricarpi CBS 119687]|uniref:3'-phosphate/5'-hydroxy nucleic acid ligase n=1 Tax=Dothidotthia symphoricarpi CBS 119687 TaxID=1392245 RepID=A0A6A6ALI2_9PLEO|nr:uncharacterized protein P153DRAFT_383826 [Dothidotthia symphoricarpi CBS 119687]KAF2131737.1 hypothetical protein P153DRAFT_383826 [Dothidotthia symphoricarpi CBS 119687]